MMKKGDKVILLIHGAGVTSKEKAIIKSIDEKSLTLEEQDRIYYKDENGIYKTEMGFAGFWFEIKNK